MIVKLAMAAIFLSYPVVFSLCKAAGNADKLIEKIGKDSLKDV